MPKLSDQSDYDEGKVECLAELMKLTGKQASATQPKVRVANVNKFF